MQRLDDHTVFASSGRFITNHTVEGVLYNSWDTARHIFVPGDDLNDLAKRWAHATEVAYHDIYMKGGDAILKGLDTGFVVSDVFSEIRQFGAVSVTVRFQRNPLMVKFYHALPQAVEIGRIQTYSTPIGTALFREFWETTSERAKIKQAERRKIIQDQHYENGKAEVFTVDMGINTALMWNDQRDREIGGETSTLILEKDEPIKWYHESEICHETWHH